MKKHLLALIVPFAVFFLAGCKPTHDVDYYKSHDNERNQKLLECRKQAEENQDADCKNAMTAYRQILNFGKSGEIHSPVVSLKPVNQE